MQRIVALGGDISCLRKIQQMNFGEYCNHNFKYYYPEAQEGDHYNSFLLTETFALFNDKSTTLRSKLKFSYDISKNIGKSKSFRIQIKSLILGTYRVRNLESLIYFSRYFFKFSNFLTIVFSLFGILRVPETIIVKMLKFRYSRHVGFEQLIDEINPNLILLLSSGYDSMFFLLSLIKNRASYLLVINNWDNPSSKAIIPKKFEFVALWNYEQVSQVIKISKKQANKLTVLGSTTSDSAHNKYANKINLKYNQPGNALLYIGQQNKYDEIADVLRIADLIRTEKTPYSRLIYRPHPLSLNKLKRIASNLKNLENVEISTSHDLNLNEYQGIISLPTTLLLEVVLSKVPAIVYLPSNRLYRKDPRTIWNYKHFDNFKSLNSLKVIPNFSKLKIAIKNGIPPQITPPTEAFQDIFPKFTENYTFRLKLIIENILK